MRAPTRGAPTGMRIYTHPQGVPLRMDDDMIYTGEGTHKGCPYGWMTI